MLRPSAVSKASEKMAAAEGASAAAPAAAPAAITAAADEDEEPELYRSDEFRMNCMVRHPSALVVTLHGVNSPRVITCHRCTKPRIQKGVAVWTRS